LAPLLPDPAITIVLAFVDVEEERRQDGKGSWRRKGDSVVSRKLLSFRTTQTLSDPEEYRLFLRLSESSPFTTADIRKNLSVSASLASRIAYFLKTTGMAEFIGKTGRMHLYRWRVETKESGLYRQWRTEN
jgi:predicted HTH transcriptional regulator